uniref:Secreted protein n=1 Tax=Ixodes scapularis TaxID=6945 RepID=A0A4D5RBV0_IXOSC
MVNSLLFALSGYVSVTSCQLCTASRKVSGSTVFASWLCLALALFISLLIYLTDVFANTCFTLAAIDDQKLLSFQSV